MENFSENAIIERIKTLRTAFAGPRGKSNFAKAIGLSSSTYSYYEQSRVPPINVLLKICELTGADLNWLLTGQEAGSSALSAKKRPSEASGAVDSGPNASLLRKLDSTLTENPRMAEALWAFVQLWLEKKQYEDSPSRKSLAQMPPAQKNSPGTERPGWIPVLGRTAAGLVHFWDQTLLPQPQQAITELDELVSRYTGKTIVGSQYGTIAVDLRTRAAVAELHAKQANLIQVAADSTTQAVEFVQCDQIYKLFPDSFALQIDGDSMSPRINDGDIVILSPSISAGQGHVAVARIANQIGVTCKLIRRTEDAVHLIPINERYETKVVPAKELLWALAVLCHLRI